MADERRGHLIFIVVDNLHIREMLEVIDHAIIQLDQLLANDNGLLFDVGCHLYSALHRHLFEGRPDSMGKITASREHVQKRKSITIFEAVQLIRKSVDHREVNDGTPVEQIVSQHTEIICIERPLSISAIQFDLCMCADQVPIKCVGESSRFQLPLFVRSIPLSLLQVNRLLTFFLGGRESHNNCGHSRQCCCPASCLSSPEKPEPIRTSPDKMGKENSGCESDKAGGSNTQAPTSLHNQPPYRSAAMLRPALATSKRPIALRVTPCVQNWREGVE